MVAIRNIRHNRMFVDQNVIYEIGSENCCIKFISEVQKHIANKSSHSFAFRLLTPRTPDQYIPDVVQYSLDALSQFSISEIIINDYGVLYALREAGIRSKFVFGRLLVRCQEYEIFYQKRIDQNEDPHVLKSWLNPNVMHSNKRELLRDLGFSAVELCPSASAVSLITDYEGFDFEIHMHFKLFMGAIGRACALAKQSNCSPGNCADLCDKGHRLIFESIYGDFHKPTIEEFREFSQNMLVGNALLFMKSEESFPYHLCREIIVDARVLDLNQQDVRGKTEELLSHISQ